VLGEALDAFTLAFVLAVEPLGVKLVAEPERLDFTVEAWKVRFRGCR
jgi:hypothetical protein